MKRAWPPALKRRQAMSHRRNHTATAIIAGKREHQKRKPPDWRVTGDK